MAFRNYGLLRHLLALVLTATWVRFGLALFLYYASNLLSGGSSLALTGTGAEPWRFPWIVVAMVTGVTAAVFIVVTVAEHRGVIRPLLPPLLAFGAIVVAAISFAIPRFSFSDDVTARMTIAALLILVFASSFMVYCGSAQAVARLSSRGSKLIQRPEE